MSGLSHDISALIANHAAGDDQGFYSVIRDMIERERRAGRRNSAQEMTQALEEATGELSALDQEDQEYTDQFSDSQLKESIQISRPEGKIEDLMVSPDIAERLRQIVNEHKNSEKLLDKNLEPSSRVLLEGPAGTGKTATAEALAHELDLPLVSVWLDSLLTDYAQTNTWADGDDGSGSGEAEPLRVIFKKLARRQAVFHFDMFDVTADDQADGQSRSIFRAFQMFLDEITPGSLAIAATNRRESLERYMLRHFDVVLNYSLPDDEVAVQVLREELGDMAPEAMINDADIYGQYMYGLSHAELVLAARDAAKAAVLRGDTHTTPDDLIYALTNRGAHILGDND